MKNKETETDLEITYLWGNPQDNEALSDDPLADLLNEFGTEDLEEETPAHQELERSPETSSQEEIETSEECNDYFYKAHFCKEEFNDDLEELQYLLKKTEYLARKLKYYNNIIQK